jgi:adenosylmethionine-8-amino-7-oxononanoate aminotransferase
MWRAHLMRGCTRAKNPIHSVLHRNLPRRPHVSDRRGNTVQISPPFIATDDEVRRLVAAIDTVLSAQEAK